ncbi:uncharacterized protein AMSG_05227 [Thecamonas trahens ATCC 50062]|uniref:Band 4.1 domain-containing protein n=1 Tax=Thecamonas trahens ATCC 50062 TaxID=461836 RepID=A0A0L0DA67_THETB|nr:hypothetical protein AMSG_05227 [Thecamonas trahens ATCC 50062]KNC49237.1 hypothetical protein AMSG_05227 [Thecamonas trahens ATCC 50062]|eukprot:XP_013757954.1 hypothetical protein AMSG_05227 [Thecamonas trahens ATCC 50062]
MAAAATSATAPAMNTNEEEDNSGEMMAVTLTLGPRGSDTHRAMFPASATANEVLATLDAVAELDIDPQRVALLIPGAAEREAETAELSAEEMSMQKPRLLGSRSAPRWLAGEARLGSARLGHEPRLSLRRRTRRVRILVTSFSKVLRYDVCAPVGELLAAFASRIALANPEEFGLTMVGLGPHKWLDLTLPLHCQVWSPEVSESDDALIQLKFRRRLYASHLDLSACVLPVVSLEIADDVRAGRYLVDTAKAVELTALHLAVYAPRELTALPSPLDEYLPAQVVEAVRSDELHARILARHAELRQEEGRALAEAYVQAAAALPLFGATRIECGENGVTLSIGREHGLVVLDGMYGTSPPPLATLDIAEWKAGERGRPTQSAIIDIVALEAIVGWRHTSRTVTLVLGSEPEREVTFGTARADEVVHQLERLTELLSAETGQRAWEQAEWTDGMHVSPMFASGEHEFQPELFEVDLLRPRGGGAVIDGSWAPGAPTALELTLVLHALIGGAAALSAAGDGESVHRRMWLAWAAAAGAVRLLAAVSPHEFGLFLALPPIRLFCLDGCSHLLEQSQ